MRPFLAAMLVLPLLAGAPAILRAQDPPGPGLSASDAVPLRDLRRDSDGDGILDRLGDTVVVAGRASLPSGILQREYLEVPIQDPTGGAFLFSFERTREIAAGDSLIVRGRLDHYQGKLQVIPDSIRIVEAPRRVPEPRDLEIERRRLVRSEGQLVRVEGRLLRLTQNAGGRMLVLAGFADPEERVTVFIPFERMDAFDLRGWEAGDRIRVVGVVGQFDPEPPHTEGYQIYPRGPGHLSRTGIPAETWRRIAMVAGWLILLGLLIWALSLRMQIRRRRRAQKRYESLFQRHPEPAAAIDPGGSILRTNPALCAITSYDPEQLADRSFFSLVPEEETLRFTQAFRGAAGGAADSFESRLLRQDGETIPVEVTVVPVEVDGGAEGMFVLAHNITERKQFQERLQERALHDYLTGLPNRALFHDRLEHALEHASRSGLELGILFVDLDRFKTINDNAGHAVGDHVLETVAARLTEVTRSADTVARYGGDEFAVLLEGAGGFEEAMTCAERILASLEDPLELQDRKLYVSASVGVALASPDSDAQEVIRRADLAMYRAKQKGGARYHALSQEYELEESDLLSLESEFREALEENQLVLHYQPLVHLESGDLVGLEALVRWEHPTRGRIHPGRFIPLAEETGLIGEMDLWVLRTAMDQVREWRDQEARADGLLLSVNVSPQHLFVDRHGDLPEAPNRADGLRVQLEITESAMARDPAAIADLHERGYLLAVDDFGTGYSALRYLKEMSVDTLKVDRSFVRLIASDSASASITRTVVTLGQLLDLRVVAEGIETSEQLQRLREYGCEFGQGYLLGRPSPLADIRTSDTFTVQEGAT